MEKKLRRERKEFFFYISLMCRDSSSLELLNHTMHIFMTAEIDFIIFFQII